MYDETDNSSTFTDKAREARRLAGRLEYAAKHGERHHVLSKDETALVVVALRYLAGVFAGDDAIVRVAAILGATKKAEIAPF
jgi:hypothetical protein